MRASGTQRFFKFCLVKLMITVLILVFVIISVSLSQIIWNESSIFFKSRISSLFIFHAKNWWFAYEFFDIQINFRGNVY